VQRLETVPESRQMVLANAVPVLIRGIAAMNLLLSGRRF
jgi:hypothetical protein